MGPENHTKKSAPIIILAIILLVIVGLVIYFALPSKQSSNNTATQKKTEKDIFENAPAIPVDTTLTDHTTAADPQLTQKQAEALVSSTWGACTKDSCKGPVTVTIEYIKGWNVVHAVYNNLLDDSTLAQKIEAKALYQNKKWALDDPTISWSCRPNRGHQDFSTVNCK